MNYAQLNVIPSNRKQKREMIAEAKKLESTIGKLSKEFEQWVLSSENDIRTYREVLIEYKNKYRVELDKLKLKWFIADGGYFERAYGGEY